MPRHETPGIGTLDLRYLKLNGGTFNSYVWPNADGAASTFLKTDGAGNLSWPRVAVEFLLTRN